MGGFYYPLFLPQCIVLRPIIQILPESIPELVICLALFILSFCPDFHSEWPSCKISGGPACAAWRDNIFIITTTEFSFTVLPFLGGIKTIQMITGFKMPSP